MNVQFTTSPGVLNVMSNKRYGADSVQCDAILLSPHPQSENQEDVMHLFFIIWAPISLFVWEQQYNLQGVLYIKYMSSIYRHFKMWKSPCSVIKFVINALHRLTCRQEIYHYKTGSMHFKRPPLNGNVFELKVKKLGSSRPSYLKFKALRY